MNCSFFFFFVRPFAILTVYIKLVFLVSSGSQSCVIRAFHIEYGVAVLNSKLFIYEAYIHLHDRMEITTMTKSVHKAQPVHVFHV